MNVEKRIKEMNLEIREYVNPDWPFTTTVQEGNILFVSGHTPTINGVPQYTGRVGEEVSLETAQKAGMLCLENCLGAIKMALGDLDRVEKIIKVNGYIASEVGFAQQAVVMNPISKALNDIFGAKHARAALGVAMLPSNVPVEVEMIVAVKQKN